MSGKKWFILFLATILLLCGLFILFNILVDPFGVFGDPIFDWFSYNFTSNPRVAKFTYLARHHQEFDSFILGASGSSAYSVERLNAYLDANFFNMFFTGADMLHLELTAEYLLENYTVENLVIGVSITNGIYFDQAIEAPLRRGLHVNAAGGSRAAFYWQYLWLNPQYAIDKIQAFRNRTDLPGDYNWYDADTGAFDKRARVAQRIGSLEEYHVTYPGFESFPHLDHAMTQIDNTIDSIRAIRDMSEAAGVNLIVIFNPLYYAQFAHFSEADIREYMTKLADVVPFWDFSMNALSFDPRFFYDPTHFREALGDMVLARIFGDDSVYMPEAFGTFVTAENVSEHVTSLFAVTAPDMALYTADVPILMYHNFSADPQSDMDVSPERFAEQMRTLYEHGFTAVTLRQLVDFVDYGIPLPERPVVITFDDGYLSVYEYAFPILEEYGLNGTSFVIGFAVGTDTYRDTSYPTIPKFCFEQARRMAGVMSIQSHSYDMHQWEPFETGRARQNILIWEGESEQAYIDILRDDHRRISALIYENLGEEVFAIAFPHGHYDTLSQAVLQSEGVRVSLATSHGWNTIIKGLPQSLLSLNRFSINDDVDEAALLAFLTQG